MSDAQAASVNANGAPVVQEKVEESPSFKIFVGNISYNTTEEGLKAFFAPVQSDVLSVQIIFRGVRPAGYGFVAVTSAEAAQNAVDLLNKKELDGREIIVEIAKPSDQKDKERKDRKAKRRPGRRGSKAVPGEVSEAEANGEAPKAEVTATPDTEEAAKPKKKKKSSRKPKVKAEGDATEAAVVAAPDAENNGDASPAKKPRVRKPRVHRPSRPAGEDPVGEPSKSMLFVANLGFNINDAGLAALFTDAGITVNSARVVLSRWGQPRRSKGFGFVDVGSEAEQQKAIDALQGKEVGGRAIAVKVAVNTPHENENAGEDKPEEVATVSA